MRALLVALAICGCKDRTPAPLPPAATQPAPPAPAPAPPSPAPPSPAPPAPTPPAKPPAAGTSAAPAPITAEEALARLPKLAGDVMIAPKATADARQVHGTWCQPGSSADAVVHDLAATLAAAGWTTITTRGDATKAGVSAERAGYRLSYVVSASSAASCRAPGHYFTSATMFRMTE